MFLSFLNWRKLPVHIILFLFMYIVISFVCSNCFSTSLYRLRYTKIFSMLNEKNIFGIKTYSGIVFLFRKDYNTLPIIFQSNCHNFRRNKTYNSIIIEKKILYNCKRITHLYIGCPNFMKITMGTDSLGLVKRSVSR